MEEILRTTDPTLVPFATALLRGEGIECFAWDVNISALECGIGAFPRRLMVRADDLARARIVLTDNGIDPFLGEDWL